MGKVIGIDLGTTNSVVAVMQGEVTCDVIVNEEGSRLTPSVVALGQQATRSSSGQVAKRQGITNPEEHHLLRQALHRPQGFE
jgi:molecular chaperone DnaK